MSMEAVRLEFVKAGNTTLYGLKTGGDVAIEAITRTDILAKILGLTVKVFNLLQKTLSNLPEYVNLVVTHLKQIAPILSTVDCIKSSYSFLAKAGTESWQSTVSQVSYIFSSLIGVFKFGDQLGIVNFGRVVLNIGGEKVIGAVTSTFSLIGASFGLWNDIEKLDKASGKNKDRLGRTLEAKKAHWKAKKAALEIPMADKTAQVAFLRTVWSESRNKPSGVPPVAISAEEARVAFEGLDALSLYHTENKINRRIKKYENKLSNASLSKTKTWLTVVDNVAKIIVGILGFVALLTGLTCLASTALPMMIAGVALGSYSLFRSIYGICQKDKSDVAQSQLEKDQWRGMNERTRRAFAHPILAPV